jgi:hypothetical protein
MLVLQDTIQYVASAPYFWNTMGMITASAMFIGATIYNGDTSKLAKWLVTTVPYTILIIAVNIMRVHGVNVQNHVQAYAGSVSVLIVSFFYFLGMLLGVGLLSFVIRKESKCRYK